MPDDGKPRFEQLRELVAKENDYQKLLGIVAEMMRLLEEEQKPAVPTPEQQTKG